MGKDSVRGIIFFRDVLRSMLGPCKRVLRKICEGLVRGIFFMGVIRIYVNEGLL